MEPMDHRQMAPAEALREMLRQAKRGNTMAQRDMIEVMNEMTRCMGTAEPDDVPDEHEEWSPTRIDTVKTETGRIARPTPPTRPPATKTMETKRTIDMYKVNIDQLDDGSAGALQNSLYLFKDFLEQADISETGGDAIQDKNLRLAMNKWCKAKPAIIMSLRNTFGESGRGDARLNHVIEVFIQPKINQRDIDPEKELRIT